MAVYLKSKQQREFRPVEFVVPKVPSWQPQVQVTMTQDVNGWISRDPHRRIKWHYRANQSYMVDEQRAVEFITKGYATGQLPRKVSDDERAEIRSVMTTVGLGDSNRAGG